MKILLVQTSFLGDVVLSTPVIAELKERFPEAQLYMLTTPLAQELVKRDPFLTTVLTFDKHGRERGLRGLLVKAKELRSYQFEVAFTLQRSFRTALLLRLAGIKEIIGFDKASFWTKLLYSKVRQRPSELHDVLRNLALLRDDVTSADVSKNACMRIFAPETTEISERVLEAIQKYPNYIVMAPGSAWETKRWSKQGYQEVFEKLVNEDKLQPFVIGSQSERTLATEVARLKPELNLAGELSLAETIYLIKNSRALICNDSMALHLGSALKIPTVVIFCATSPSFGFGPWQNKAKVVECQDLKCKPCARHGTRVCPTGTNYCSKRVKSAEVLSALAQLLEDKD